MAPTPISKTGCCDPSRGGGESAFAPPKDTPFAGSRQGTARPAEQSTGFRRQRQRQIVRPHCSSRGVGFRNSYFLTCLLWFFLNEPKLGSLRWSWVMAVLSSSVQVPVL